MRTLHMTFCVVCMIVAVYLLPSLGSSLQPLSIAYADEIIYQNKPDNGGDYRSACSTAADTYVPSGYDWACFRGGTNLKYLQWTSHNGDWYHVTDSPNDFIIAEVPVRSISYQAFTDSWVPGASGTFVANYFEYPTGGFHYDNFGAFTDNTYSTCWDSGSFGYPDSVCPVHGAGDPVYAHLYARATDLQGTTVNVNWPATTPFTITGAVDGLIEPTAIEIQDDVALLTFYVTEPQSVDFSCSPMSTESAYMSCGIATDATVSGGDDDIDLNIPIYYTDVSFLDENGQPLSNLTIPIEGGTYAFRYNFDNTGCQLGKVIGFYRAYYPNDTAKPPYPTTSTWNVSVYPAGGSFNGIVSLPMPARSPGQVYDVSIDAKCYDSSHPGSTDTPIVDVTKEFTGIGTATTSPCDGLGIDDPGQIVTCLVYRFNETVIKPIFVGSLGPDDVMDSINNLKVHGPFILITYAYDSVVSLVDIFDVERASSPPHIGYHIPILEQDFSLDDAFAPITGIFDFAYSAAGFFCLYGVIWSILAMAGIVGKGGEDD